MRTMDVLDRIPESVAKQLDFYRHIHRRAEKEHDDKLLYEAMNRASGYTKGLMDAGLITDRERMLLFLYTTV